MIRSTKPEDCTGERYATYTEASPVLKALNSRRRDSLMAVQCSVCHGWHLAPRTVPMEARHVRA